MRLYLTLCIAGILILTDSAAALPTDSAVVSQISISGNKRTKDRVILREIALKHGDTIAIANLPLLINQSTNYLMNTALFHTVDIRDSLAGDQLYIDIKVRERWYIIPEPNLTFLDRNFNVWWQTKDLDRITASLELTHHNFRGMNEELTVDASIGWRQKLALVYGRPYLNKRGILGMQLEGGYIQGHEMGINTIDNQLVYHRLFDRNIMQQYAFQGSVIYRPRLKSRHYFRAGFSGTSVDDSVIATQNSALLGNGRTEIQVPTLTYQYVYNTRDQQFYPLKGQYLVGSLQKSGLPGVADDVDITTLDLTYHRFFKLAKNLYAAAGTKVQHKLGAQLPYLYRSSLGYSYFVRGYEYYVIDGRTLLLANTELKYKLVDKEFYFKFIPFEQFNRIPLRIFAKAFFDAGYVAYEPVQYNNTMLNSPLSGWGAGLDFTSYYDRILRVEYSFNNLGRAGLYIHLVEVF